MPGSPRRTVSGLDSARLAMVLAVLQRRTDSLKLHDREVFAATVEATEESVLNALWAAPDVKGRSGRVVPGLPHDDVLEVLARNGRLGER